MCRTMITGSRISYKKPSFKISTFFIIKDTLASLISIRYISITLKKIFIATFYVISVNVSVIISQKDYVPRYVIKSRSSESRDKSFYIIG